MDYVLDALEHTDIATARARRAGADAEELVSSIAEDEQFLADLATDYGSRRINRSQFLAAQDPIQQRLGVSRTKLDRVTLDPDIDNAVRERISAETWDDLDLDQQRALIRLFIDHVIIQKGKPGRTFDPSRVRPVPVESA